MFDRTVAAETVQACFVLVGLVLFWRLVVSPPEGRRPPARLPAWEITLADFFTFLLYAIGLWLAGGLLGSIAANTLSKRQIISSDGGLILASAASQLGMLAGVLAYAVTYPRQFGLTKQDLRLALRSGVATYFIATPFVYLAGFVWLAFLKLVHLPVEKQPAIELFSRTKAYGWLTFLVIVAVAMAPVAEEMIFRAGFFRYLRTRTTRWIALVAPACIFAALHQNLASFGQLVALAVVFSVAYERTGQIGTSIVAHALFNLNTVVMLLLGVDF